MRRRTRCPNQVNIAAWLVGYVLALVLLYILKRNSPTVLFERTRPGEVYIGDDDFILCTKRLLYHENSSPEFLNIPLLVIPVTMDYLDLKTFICNISFPVRNIMIINNGDFKPMKRLLDRLRANLPTERLIMHHYPENIGYAAAVNVGFSLALRRPDISWVYVSNCDVRFFGNTLQTLATNIHSMTRHDKELIDSLRREVASEVDAGERRWTSGSVVSSSDLLPQRYRMMGTSEMAKQFESKYGLFFVQEKIHFCSFAVSKLLLSTVGVMDENYYPAYGEDFDYLWRAEALGFKMMTSEKGSSVHYENANLRVLDRLMGEEVLLARDYLHQFSKFSRMNYHPLRLDYRRKKWFPHSVSLYVDENRSRLPFGGRLPVDVWIKDTKRIESIGEIGMGATCRRYYIPYNTTLLDILHN